MHTDLMPNSEPAASPSANEVRTRRELGLTATVNAAEPMERIRGLVAGALFGGEAPSRAIGRFRLQRELGAGGMGVVYAAHDSKLERTIALKVLHPRTRGDTAGTRLQREAQAMARLRHPNVLTVFETGTHGDQVFVAMEYVEGGTLGEWLAGGPRPWREVLDKLLQAGRGLLAAHRVGLVHRDFKPANALLDGDGRVLVADFGLARSGADPVANAILPAGELERTDAGDGDALLDATLTQTGALVGTPAYMSPEQFAGVPATPRSDQFSFCVVLYEALYGERPFAGADVGELAVNVERGLVKRAPRGARVPSGVRAVILRGLSVAPGRRFPSMDELLRALERAARPRSRLWLGIAAVAAACLGTGVLVLSDVDPDAADEAAELTCQERADSVKQLWNDDARASVRAAFETLALDAGAYAELDATLTEYAGGLAGRYGERCIATSLGAAAAAVDVCLEDRRAALGELVATVTAVAAGEPVTRGLAGDSTRERPSTLDMTYRTGDIAGAPAAADLLPPLTCASGDREPLLIGEGGAAERRASWGARLLLGEFLRPRALAETRDASDETLARMREAERRVRPVSRVAHELRLAAAVAAYQQGERAEPPATLTAIARAAVDAGHHDIAARAWTLALEMFEAGRHSGVIFEELTAGAAAAVEQLPRRDPLRIQLLRDLGYLSLSHARHLSDPGECAGEQRLAFCRPAIAATMFLQAAEDGARELEESGSAEDGSRAAGGPWRERVISLELLALALEHLGERREAERARRQSRRMTGERRRKSPTFAERELDYLELSRGVVVSEREMPSTLASPTARAGLPDIALTAEASVRCPTDRRCLVKRDFVENHVLANPSSLEQQARVIPALKDGESRGLKLYGIRDGSLPRLLGFKNGDLLTRVDGHALVDARSLLDPEVTRSLRGDKITVEFVRKRETVVLEVSIRDALDDVADEAREHAGAREAAGAAEADEAPALDDSQLAAAVDAVRCDAASRTCELPRRLWRHALANPDPFVAGVGIEFIKAHGLVRGARLTGVRDAGLLSKLELRDGDIITALGDVALRFPDSEAPTMAAATATIAALGDAASFVVRYRRGDAFERLTLRIVDDG